MRYLPLLALAGATVLLTGCDSLALSLHPLYEDEDVVFEPKLLGSWSGQDSGDVFTFAASPDKSYRLVWTTSDETHVFRARLVRLQRILFLDLTAGSTGELFVLPVHAFAKIRLDGDVLHYALLDSGWLGRTLESNPAAVEAAWIGPRKTGGVILVAPTGDLQHFVLCYEGDQGAFPPSEPLRRLGDR